MGIEALEPDFVRVKDRDTKHEYSVVASAFDEKYHELLDKPATHTDGTALPPKHHIDPKSLSSKTSSASPGAAPSGQKAAPEKEAD